MLHKTHVSQDSSIQILGSFIAPDVLILDVKSEINHPSCLSFWLCLKSSVLLVNLPCKSIRQLIQPTRVIGCLLHPISWILFAGRSKGYGYPISHIWSKGLRAGRPIEGTCLSDGATSSARGHVPATCNSKTHHDLHVLFTRSCWFGFCHCSVMHHKYTNRLQNGPLFDTLFLMTKHIG